MLSQTTNSFNSRIKIAIVGATGYTGRELIRLLLAHPNADILYLSSRTHQGVLVKDYFDNLGLDIQNQKKLKFCTLEEINYKKCDLVFFTTPHNQAMKLVGNAIKHCKIIDLSADFRIKDVLVWERFYGEKHCSKELLDHFVYGLSEIYAKKISRARLVANPGCYPTSILLPLIPLIQNRAIKKGIVADCKSGTSGAGAKADLSLNLSEIGNNFKLYNAFNHRHVPEIVEQMKIWGLNAKLTFTANFLPIPRGMMSSIYLKKRREVSAFKILQEYYKNSIFVKVVNQPASAQIKSVFATNCCIISVFEQQEKLLIVSVIDNLIKGASGQAVENMNLMFGLKRELGLTKYGIYP